MQSTLSADEVIRLLKLEPLPVEGGLFRQTWRSSDVLPLSTLSSLSNRYQGEKPAGTAIFALLTDDPDSFSAMHILPTDEVYHFYLGDPIEMLHLYRDGQSERVILGQDLLAGQYVQYIARRQVWQGFRLVPGGKWGLLGTTMAPGFTVPDFVLGERDELSRMYPNEVELIRRLTRIGPIHETIREA